MGSSYHRKVSIVIVTICLINIFPRNACTSPVIVDGKYSLDSFFHPIQNNEECNNYYTNNQYVCDPNSYITYPDKQKLGDIMQKTQNNPIITCPFNNDGIHFGVLIISSFNDYHSNKINQGFDMVESSKFYAKLYHEKWEIGNEQCNNGILIFLNVKDHHLHISTSTFLKTNYISDEFINNEVMPHIRSYLKNEQFADGIIKTIELITDKCQEPLVDKRAEREHKSDNTTTRKQRYNDNGFWIFVILISVGFTMWLIWYTKCCNCCCGECCDGNPHRRRRDNNNVRNEGVPFNEPGMQYNNVNRMGYNNNGHLRARNVHKIAETLRKERERKERKRNEREERERNERQRTDKEEKLRVEQRKNEQLVQNGKRTKNGGGGGMSW